MLRTAVSGILCVLLLAAGLAGEVPPAGAQAPSESDVFVDLGVLAYDERQYGRALEAFQEALRLNPENVNALYYSGLTYLALEQYPAARGVLEQAYKLAPADPDVAFQFGVALFLAQDYAAAEPVFRQVRAVQPDRQNLGYYLGFIEYRKQNYREALRAFRANVPSDETFAQLARFYAGLSLSALGLATQARAEIEEALRLQPISPLTGPAERFRDVLGAAAEAERPWRIEAKLSFFYDDNVTVNPEISNDPTAEASRAKERRSTGELGFVRFEYVPLRTPDWEGSLSYGLLQTLNNDVSDFNIQNHTLAGSLAYKTSLGGMPAVGSLIYQYDYVALDDRDFVSRHTLAPGGTLVWNATHLTQAQGRFQFKDFLHERGLVDPGDRRDAFNYLLGFTHYLRFQADRHYVRGGYQLDWEEAEGGNWDYLGHRFLLGGQYTAPWDLRLRYDFDIHFRDYRGLHSFLPTGIAAPAIHRIDRDMNHLFSISKDLPHNLSVAVEYLLNRSISNLAVYDYIRNVISLSLSWRY